MGSVSPSKLSEVEAHFREVVQDVLGGGVFDFVSAFIDDWPEASDPSDDKADFMWHDGKQYGIRVTVTLEEVE